MGVPGFFFFARVLPRYENRREIAKILSTGTIPYCKYCSNKEDDLACWKPTFISRANGGKELSRRAQGYQLLILGVLSPNYASTTASEKEKTTSFLRQHVVAIATTSIGNHR